MARMNLEDLKKHIHEGSEAMLASLNPFGAVYREIEHLKTFLNTVLLIECFDSFIDDKCGSVRSYSYIRSFDYKDYPELALLKSRKNPRAEPVQMERLISSVGNL